MHIQIHNRIHYKTFQNVFIYVTEKCNLHCPHCYLGERLQQGHKMSFRNFKSILRYFLLFGYPRITLLGGEPTLHKDLPLMIKESYDMGFQTILDTNGIFPISLFNELNNEHLLYLSFSLDGSNKKVHDTIRGKGTFEKTISNIRYAAKLGFNVRVLPTVSMLNISDAPNIVALADVLGASCVNFHIFSAIGLGSTHLEWAPSPRAWRVFSEILRKKAGSYDIVVWYPPTYCSKEELINFVGKGYRGCVARYFDRCDIFPDGTVYLCAYFFDTPYNFATYTGKKLLLNPKTNEIKFQLKVQEPCWDCSYFSICKGGCAAERILKNSWKCNDDVSICRLWKIRADE